MSINRINTTLTRLQADKRSMLSPYITAGDPHPDATVDIMHALVAAGADILELGIPFSDPMAEGPVIQHAMERALAHGVTVHDVLAMVRKFREQNQDTPVVIMGYLNPIEQYGYEAFAKEAVKAGADGTILVDLPPEEANEVLSLWKKYGLCSIFLCSPTTSDDRMALIDQCGEGYLYYVSLKGVTGSDALQVAAVKSQYEYRKAQTRLPLMVGFGIKTPEMAAQVAAFSDGVIVGAALITQIIEAYEAKNDVKQAAAAMIKSMRQAMDNLGTR